MAFYKQKKKQDQFIQTVFANDVELKFNKWKKFYGIIKIGNQSFVEVYEGKYRSEALTYLEEFARLNGGHLDTFSVLK